ncbi:non-ribosomal peptide synthetase/type I polyketide synthase [Oceaniglobus trochenteri]|uniref:non-ribosomal peptide synthetase/type I polyketide synthase n=1 Tax=Oceaniglobus trochenteri TaxID=2763260 RepID=UPI001CFFC5D3|nr:non-ribosomal peptide synthetase/type I polyketide synthase [Oceaniglobus trochenteri]
MTQGASIPDDLQGAIAITGIAGRFPGAASVESFWKAVREGRDLIRPHAPETLADNFTDAERARDTYVPVRPAIEGAEMFDAPFFDMLPREAAQTDPQFRVFLETCWQALEDAGHDPARPPGPIGVFGGASMSTYFLNNLMSDRAKIEDFVSTYQLGDYQQFMGALGDTLATRVAFRLGLTGPAVTVATACSTSLVAVAQACQSLDAFHCDMALAGGVSITFPQERGYFYQEGGMVSRDGHCRPFDAGATGTVFGHGAGVVVLRRYEDALADGDQVYALIRGAGLNNDGADKIAFTAPSVTGQAMAIAQAQGAAGVDPGSIGYVECHGTGTPLGDPVEFEGLKKAFAGVAPGRVFLGSAKANIGHCDAAAGVIGLIKTALMLRDRTIPPMANYIAPNPQIDLDPSPFRIPTLAQDWDEPGPLRAGVSALGVGGTNAHLVLEEAPAQVQPARDGLFILPLSGKDGAALASRVGDLAERLGRDGAPSLADVAFTLQQGRCAFDHRHAVAATCHADAVAALRAPFRAGIAMGDAPPVMFMFPGQGAQYPGMGQGLRASEPGFARIIRQGSEILQPLIGLDLDDLLYAARDGKAAARVLRDTAITQPALYLVEYATARLWQARGISPAAMIGHSVGEFTAATLAGVMSFETGLHLIAARGRLMQDQPAGAMLSVRSGFDRVEPLLCDGVDLAARNAPQMIVLAGPDAEIGVVEARLHKADIPCKRLHTSHAFHSAMMDPVAAALADEAAKHAFGAPQIPYVSCVTGTWITDAEAMDPAYWARHCRAAVNFDTALHSLCAGNAAPVLVEVGPGRSLGAFAAQAVAREGRRAILQSLPDHSEADRDRETMGTALGALWSQGVKVDWSAGSATAGRRVSLPGYPFQKKRHWIDAPLPLARQGAAAPETALSQTSETSVAMSTPSAPRDRTETLTARVLALLCDLSGDSLTDDDSDCTFLELGFDSLLLGQVTQRLQRDMGVTLTFRQLMGDLSTVGALVAHLDATLPPEMAAPEPAPRPDPGPAPGKVSAASGDIGALMQAQTQAMLSLFENQMRTMGAGGAAPVAPPSPPAAARVGRAPVAATGPEAGSRHDMNRRATAQAEFTPEQLAFVGDLCAEYGARFPTSKARAQNGRRALADPRTASGFRAEWKELVFPVIAETSKGARLTDPDGNSLVDLVNGFGQTAFGHAPDFVTRAIAAQMEKGFAIGPQTPLAHEVAGKFLAITGHERVTFCNTGSEAVMAAMRLARTVTGRDTVVCFKGDYHGQFDEVLVKGRASGDPTALPAVAGVPSLSVANMVVLEYGSEAALDWIRDNIGEIAAVLIEPVQSRHPELRPRAFCEEVRRITDDGGAAFILDEIVTGFRVARGGMQELWDIRADMVTYGKVVGGGMPLGVLSGSARFLDALDGGFWAFGDESSPEVPPTFFAGTFVRHPLVLAALSAVLDHIDGEGSALYHRVAPRTDALLGQMNDILEDRGLPRAVTGFSSWMIVNLSEHDPRAALLYPLMRLGGVHVHDGYPWFLTTAHSEADFETVAQVFAAAIDRLQAVGILAGDTRRDALPVTLPLTEPQKEVWMAAQLGAAASGVFIESVSLRLAGVLDATALEQALNAVVARHDSLRLRFAASGEAAEVMARLRLTLDPQPMDKAALSALIAADARRPFDLVNGPLVRATLARLGDEDHVLILTTYHIVCDGWSTYLIVEELAALYNAQLSGRDAKLPPAARFAEYALSQEGRAPADSTLEFWRNEFPEAPDLPDLPLDRPRRGARGFDGATHVHLIDADLAKRLKRAAGREGVTLFAALSGALAAMLGRIGAASRVVLAVPTAGQTLLPDDRLVGHCVNLLPISFTCDGGESLRTHLKRCAGKVLDCFDHGDTTYGAILRTAGLRGDINRQPLSEVQFNLDQQPADFGFSGLNTAMEANPRAHTNFDLIFNVTESGAGLRVDLTYASDVLGADTVARWCRQYHRLLAAIADDMDTILAAAPLLSPDEEVALAALGNDTETAMPPHARADAMIAAQARATPDAPAIEDAAGTLDYAGLMAKSDRLAAALQRRLPRPGAPVAVMIDRSADLVVALLAVMRAGHAYVPLDPQHPPARLRAVLEASGARGLIHRGAAPDVAGGLDLACIPCDGHLAEAAPLPLDEQGDPAAYVIFTSGTTGTPKGVEVPHSALANLLSSMAGRPGFGAHDSLLAVTTVAFDIAALELLLPLTRGGRVVIAGEDEVREAFPLVERLKRGDITMLQATPTLWQMLLEAGFSPDPALKILVGGEALPRDLADRLLAGGGAVWNMYGPTETTIWSSCGPVGAGAIDIGTPIANTVMHVLDDNGGLAPVGVVGELNIGGAGLARGYLNRSDLTEAAFRTVDLPGQGAVRLYRTGDLARRGGDGTITLLGRRDGQVKLRGFRIELDEIEAALRDIDGIRAAAVDLRDGPAGPLLAGFYVAEADRDDLGPALGRVLPGYMVPTRFQRIAALPETANGKLDRRALPDLEPLAPLANLREITAPRSALESTLVEIWRDVLGLEALGITDNLFELGADSLSIFRIAARMLERDLGIEARHLMQHPTIQGVVAFAESRTEEPRAPSLKDFRNGARRKTAVSA